jgi:hypothetical protein
MLIHPLQIPADYTTTLRSIVPCLGSVLEDPERPGRRLIYRHYRQPGEKPDVRTSFGFSEVSPVLEHYAAKAGIEYSKISRGRQTDSFDLALSIVQSGLGLDVEGTPWLPVIPWVRDEGFCAVLMREPIPFEEACHLFGLDIPAAKPSVPKRIKRHLARGRTALFGSEAEVRQLNQYNRVHRVILADRVTSFETAVYDPGPRWPEAWTSGAALASRRGGALLTGHPVQIGDLIQITGALPSGQIKANCLIWDIDYDLVVFDIKKELRSWNGEVYLSVLNELHGSPANLDVQTASNLDLAKVRDHKLIRYLCQEYACDVFDLMRDDERVKEEIGFYNPASWADEDGNPVMSENRWKLWKMYAAGLPAMQFRNCRDAFYRTQMESPENTDPNRFRIRFREPEDLMTVKAEELAGAAVRIHTRQRTPRARRPIRGCRFLRSSPDHETPSGLHATQNRCRSAGAIRTNGGFLASFLALFGLSCTQKPVRFWPPKKLRPLLSIDC